MAAIDEFQRELIVEGTMEGLAAARARGRTGGRKAKLSPPKVKLARQLYDENGEDGKRAHRRGDRRHVRRHPHDDLPGTGAPAGSRRGGALVKAAHPLCRAP